MRRLFLSQVNPGGVDSMTRQSRSNGVKEGKKTAAAVRKLLKEGRYGAAAKKYGTDVVAYGKSVTRMNRGQRIEKELRYPERHGLTHRGRGGIGIGTIVRDTEGNEAVFLWLDNGRPLLTTPALWDQYEPQYRRRRTRLQVKHHVSSLSRGNPNFSDTWAPEGMVWEHRRTYLPYDGGKVETEVFFWQSLNDAFSGGGGWRDPQEEEEAEEIKFERTPQKGWRWSNDGGEGEYKHAAHLVRSGQLNPKAKNNPQEWVLVDVDEEALRRAVSGLSEVFDVSVRRTTEGDADAVAVMVAWSGIPNDVDVQDRLSWAGTIVGSTGHPAGDRSWATGPKKYIPRVQSPLEMAHRGRVAANFEARGKYPSKPKSKRPWQKRSRARANNPVAIIIAALIPLLIKLGQSQLDRFYAGSRSYQLRKIRQVSKGSPPVWFALKNERAANSVVDWLITDEGKMVVEEGLQASVEVSKARNNGPVLGRPHYPFAEKEEQYAKYTMAQLHSALDDAASTSKVQQGWNEAGANWYLDDYHTIGKEIRRRGGSEKWSKPGRNPRAVDNPSKGMSRKTQKLLRKLCIASGGGDVEVDAWGFTDDEGNRFDGELIPDNEGQVRFGAHIALLSEDGDSYRFWLRHARGNPSKRQRKKQSGRFTVYHADHGITKPQMTFIQKRLDAVAPQGFFVKQVNIPKRLGPVPNALYGPDSGDRAVSEARVSYLDRSGRGWEDRMIDLPVRPINYVQTIGIRDGNKFTLFTVYGGPLAPQNPADPNNPNPAAAEKWWSKHALSSQQWKKR